MGRSPPEMASKAFCLLLVCAAVATAVADEGVSHVRKCNGKVVKSCKGCIGKCATYTTTTTTKTVAKTHTTSSTHSSHSSCSAQATKATAACTSQLKVATAKAKKACGGKNYKDVLKRIAHLKHLASEQEKALKRGEKALALVRANAARIAKMSGKERAKLLAELRKQKSSKHSVHTAESKYRSEAGKVSTYRTRAEAAFSHAVKVAQATDDSTKISSAKSKAHTLFHKMVNAKVHMAHMHHAVVSAKASLHKISMMVQKEIGIAKETAKREAGALKDVAKSRENVAHHKKMEAQDEVSAASTAENAAVSSEKKVIHKIHRSEGDIKSGKREVRRASQIVKNDKKYQKSIHTAKIKSGSLKMSVLKKEARAYHQGHVHEFTSKTTHHSHHSHHSGMSIHTQYANKVKALEQKRLAAKRHYHQAEASLAKLKQTKAGASAITQAQAKANNAAAALRQVVTAQKAAVAQAVHAVQAVGHH